MKISFILIIFAMVLVNLWCFYKSRKYLNKVDGEGEESKENYDKGLKYIKISVVISLLICLTGSLAIIIVKVI
ncbi:MAG: hypothetical protein E7213_09060 [Clostridium sp.]|nr:hypothetical protein [Clostridium sp.]